MLKEGYVALIKKSNKKSKDWLKGIEMAGKGICPGCKECMPGRGYMRKLPRKHAIGSMDCKAEAVVVREITEALDGLNQRLSALQALDQEEEEDVGAL